MGLFDRFKKRVKEVAEEVDSDALTAMEDSEEGVAALESSKHIEEDWEDNASEIEEERFEEPTAESLDDDWDDWDDEDGGDTGNEALSNELGWFVHRLHVVLGGNVSNLFDKAEEGFALNRPAGLDQVSNSLGPGQGEEECGLHALGFDSAKDMDVLHWSLQMYNLR